MKTTLLGGVVGAALMMAGMQSPALATTYNYVGNTYQYNYDPASYGSNMTASVTFDFDTSAYTGQVFWTDGHISDIFLKSGSYSVSGPLLTGSWIILDSGVITQWWIDTVLHPPGIPDMISTYRLDRTPPSTDRLNPVYGGPFFQRAQIDNAPGNWSVTPLPAALPLFGTGLGVMGLLGWNRKRKNAAAVAA